MNRYLTALAATAEVVDASADDLNKLDAFAGDGDLGVTMARAASAVTELLPQLDGHATADVLRKCGAAIAQRAPSTCGTLIATGLLRAARAAEAGAASDAATLARLLDAARDGIAQRGGAETGSKTLLDALAPAVAAAAYAANAGLTLETALERAAEAADAGALSTVSMQPRHGRAGWLAGRSSGHEDAGARLVAIMLKAYAGALRPAS